MADEWFRSPAWELADQTSFEERLARARPANRAQYLRVKAVALRDAGNLAGADELFARITDDEGAPVSERAFAHEALGDLLRLNGDLHAAVTEYRLALDEAPTLSGTTGEVQLSLGETLLDIDGDAGAAEVSALLDTAQEHVKFNSTAFRWNVLRARLAEVVGDNDARRAAALAALELVGAASQFPRHPTVGVVDAPPETIELLRRLSSA